MPVYFLTDEQRRRYGRFNAVPQEAQLGGFFHLGAEDRRRAVAAHGARNQLGWSVQLGTLRFLGTFLADPESAPVVVIGYVADQLGLDAAALKGYGEKEARWDHQAQIRDLYGYTAFGTIQWLGLARWLYRRAWHANERPSVLFDLATHRLVEAKILLPGVTTLERLVAGIRDRAAARTYRVLAAAPNPAQRAALEALVVVEPGQRMSALDRHRRSPVDISGKGVVKALARYEALRGFGAQTWDLSEVPPGRVHGLARFAKAARAQAVAELSPDRRLATLAAFATVMEPTAADEAIEVVDLVIGDLVRTAGFRAARQRLRTLKDVDAPSRDARGWVRVGAASVTPATSASLAPTHVSDLDVAARILREAWLAITQDAAAGRDVAARIAAMDIAAINSAAAVVAELAREPDEDIQPELTERYATIRRFLPRLLKVINFAAAGPQGQHLLQALDFLPDIDKRRGLIHRDEPPTEFLTPAWYRRVFPTQGEKAGGFDKRAYTVAAAERLRETLRRHEVFVPGLRKWGDPTAGLLHGAAWDKAREPICRDLGLSPEPGPDIDIWAARLDACYRQLADGLAENPSVRIEVRDGRDHLVLTGLDKLDEPDSLTALRADVDARIPTLDLPEAILEVHSWTGFLDHFTHVSDTPTRTPDMTTSVAAVLAAQAMNVGMGPMVHDGNPALALDRLFWAEQNYLRADTLSSANAALVEYHSRLPLVEAWGGGELASADGLRFVVPVKTINTGPNPKFFGKGKGARGATYYNFTSDQFLGFHAIVVPGTPKDWYFILEGLLEQDSPLRPTQVTSDTSGASEIAFGVFRMLGWQFSPRLADAGSATLYRTDPTAFYGPLQPLTRARVNTAIIRDSWDDLLRIIASLRTGAVKASELFRYLAGGGTPTPAGRALMEVGKLDRSAYLALYFDDELLRRRVGTQLNRQESRHELCRRIYHGQKGELRQRYREGQEDQLGALGLVANICVLWKTVYTARALEAIRAEGTQIAAADIARLSPLGFDHLNMLGRYNFSLPEIVQGGQLRPLRTPTPL